MEDVVFDEERRLSGARSSSLGNERGRSMVRFLMRRGIAKSEPQASLMLIGLAAVCSLAAIIIVYIAFSAPSVDLPAHLLEDDE